MFCRYCGNPIEDNTSVCPYCGNKITENMNSQMTSQKRLSKKKRRRKVICMLSVLVVIVILLVVNIINVVLNRELKEETSFDENNIGEIYFCQTEKEHISTNKNGVMYVDNEILLVVSESASYENIEKLAKKYDAEIVGWIEQTGDYQLKFPNEYSEEELKSIVSSIENDKRVDSVYLNYIFNISGQKTESRDGFIYGDEWENDLQNFNNCKGKSWGLEAIEALAAWDILDAHANQVNPVRIGLIDSGFDVEHEDLGFVETFYNSDSDHGTHVAGTMAAKSTNKEGICGVYPYGDGNLYGVSYEGICNYSENGNPMVSSMFLKIAYAELILRNVKVINSSLAFNYYLWPLNYTEPEWQQQVEFLESNAYILADFLNRLLDKGYDFVLINAAGNDSEREKSVIYDSKYSFWTTVISEEDYPEVYDRIIVVGAVDSDFNVCDFSNGGERVDIHAPGYEIFSTIQNNEYDGWNGTSMAAPHVSGIAAMVWSINNNLSGSQVKEIICKYSNMRCTSCKMVDAYVALEAALHYDTKTVGKWEENGGVLCWVVDVEDESIKVENALVTATNTETGEAECATTDAEGHFELILPEGEYTLTVQADGYEDYVWSEDNSNFSGFISVKTGGVNYLGDWIKLKRINVLSKFAGTYTLDVEKTNSNNGSSLGIYFGSGINYGYEMILNEDGTASWYIGIGNGGEGIYSMQEGRGILEYYGYEDGNKKLVELTSIEENNKKYIVMDYNDYSLYWISNESSKMEEMLFEETGLNPVACYYDMFAKDGTYGMIAIYQYDSEWMAKDNCQVWYCDGNSVTQLFEWENTSGNAFCNVNSVALYENSEGFPYVILNTWQRVAMSYEYCQIFGADKSGIVNKVYEVEGNAAVENGELILNEAITEFVDGIPETTIQKYHIDIIDGVVQRI